LPVNYLISPEIQRFLDDSEKLRHTAAALAVHTIRKGRFFVMLQGFARLGALAALLSLALTMPARADEWQPVSPGDLQMKEEPKAPKAAAIFLYRQVDRDDANSIESIYSRIKVLTDEGRKYANVEIPYKVSQDLERGIHVASWRRGWFGMSGVADGVRRQR
jgi:hypothetical protein